VTSAPLSGVTVVDLTRGLAGSICTLQLADAGARVIVVEAPEGNPLRRLPPPEVFSVLARDKESIAVEPSSTHSTAVLHRLAEIADVIVIDWEVALSASHLQYEKLAGRNERLVYCLLSPYSEDGVYADLPATELELQGITGHMSFLGEHGGPPVRTGADIGEVAAGMHACTGILAALLVRDSTRKGQRISISAATALLSVGSHWMADFSSPDEFAGGVTHPYEVPEAGYRCKDKQVIFGFFGRRADKRDPFQELLKGLGLEDLLKNSFILEHGAGYVGVGRDAQEMKPLLEESMKSMTAEEFINLIDRIGGRAAPFMGYDELFGDPPHPEVEAASVLFSLEGGHRVIRSPWSADEEIGRTAHDPAPGLGQHSRAVLAELGFSEDEIRSMQTAGAVGCGDETGGGG
jgi:crotonobetainyl-CoA:carnitine CoA-transferase CaiB-like acyl-CoA transferase